MTRDSAMPAALTAVAAVGAAGVAAAVWGIAIERHLYALRTHELALLPPGSKPIRVLHVSDPHMAPWQKNKQRWMAALADLGPDLVVNTGDNLGHEDGLAGIRSAFAPLAGVPGFFVHGSNDRVGPKARNPLRYFQGPSRPAPEAGELDAAGLDSFFTDDLGWHDLNNTAATVTAGGVSINAFGVSDAHRDWDDLDAASTALAALRVNSAADLIIGVTHAPYRRILDEYIDLGAQAIFAGHTHGGQVCVPVWGALVANCDIPLRQASGLSTWTHGDVTVPLNVSAGLGNSIYAPVRFACRPEASLITLTARA